MTFKTVLEWLVVATAVITIFLIGLKTNGCTPPPPANWDTKAASSQWEKVPMRGGPDLKRCPMGNGWVVLVEPATSGASYGLTWVPDTAPVASRRAE